MGFNSGLKGLIEIEVSKVSTTKNFVSERKLNSSFWNCCLKVL
jgi:hypothetical protein